MTDNPMQRAPRCGAHARRTGQPCRSPAMANGRCRMHGGKAGRKATHGHYTKAAIAERQRAHTILRMLRALREILATGTDPGEDVQTLDTP